MRVVLAKLSLALVDDPPAEEGGGQGPPKRLVRASSERGLDEHHPVPKVANFLQVEPDVRLVVSRKGPVVDSLSHCFVHLLQLAVRGAIVRVVTVEDKQGEVRLGDLDCTLPQLWTKVGNYLLRLLDSQVDVWVRNLDGKKPGWRRGAAFFDTF